MILDKDGNEIQVERPEPLKQPEPPEQHRFGVFRLPADAHIKFGGVPLAADEPPYTGYNHVLRMERNALVSQAEVEF